MTDRRDFLTSFGAGLFVLSRIAGAQQAGKVWRIGYLGNTPPMNVALRQALQESGYVEGSNAVFERRFADGIDERNPALAAELVRLNLDVLVTVTGSATDAAKAATATIPIVMAAVGDPVGRGLVKSLGRPGGNITGVAELLVEMIPRHIELLKEAVPQAARVVILTNRGGWDSAKLTARWKEEDASVQALGVILRRVEINAPSEFDSATAAIVRERPDALLLGPASLNLRLREEIAEFAVRERLPTMATLREQALAGIMMSYGPSNSAMFRSAATYVDRILKGAKPADLPIEPAKFSFVINLKTAKALGITIPQSLLLRADEVIR